MQKILQRIIFEAVLLEHKCSTENSCRILTAKPGTKIIFLLKTDYVSC